MKKLARITILYVLALISLGGVAHAQVQAVISAIQAAPAIIKAFGELPDIVTNIHVDQRNAKYIRDLDRSSVILVKYPINRQSDNAIKDLNKNRVPQGQGLDDTNDGYSFVHIKSSKSGDADYHMVPRSQIDSQRIKEALENPDPQANKEFMENLNEFADSDRFKRDHDHGLFKPNSEGARLGWNSAFNQQHAVIMGKGDTLKFNLAFWSPQFIVNLGREFDALLTELGAAKKTGNEEDVKAVMAKYNMSNLWFPVTSHTTGITLYFYLPDILERLAKK